MITLGFSGISVALVASQFIVLNRRLNRIETEVKKLGHKIDQTIEADLTTELSLMRSAEPSSGNKRDNDYNKAREKALTAGAYFLNQALDPAIHESNLAVVRLYSGKYFSALSIEIGSLLGLEETKEVTDRLNIELPNLKAVVSQVFKQTSADDVEWYLAPELQDEASLQSISDLFEQAKKFECVPNDAKMTQADVFETNRKGIYSSGYLRTVSPKFHSFRKAAAQKLQIAQAKNHKP
ncbi:MAG: hypothetical protein QOD99_607 [Chthoniobacter sp.]|jgi:hypothetical protein|nr:hypothetical protein [Chthoniobacter sp.]